MSHFSFSKRTKLFFSFTLIIMTFSISCQKNSPEAKSKSDGVQQSTITNTTKSKYKSIKEILQKKDRIKLENLIKKIKEKHNMRLTDSLQEIPTDPVLEEEAAQIVRPINAEILAYLSQAYPQFGSTSMVDINDPDFTYFAQVYSIAEQSGFITPANSGGLIAVREIPTWLRCTVDIVMGYFDVTSLIAGLGTFEFGTVWTVVKFAVKKYVGWFAAAILIYDITTECL